MMHVNDESNVLKLNNIKNNDHVINHSMACSTQSFW